MSAKKQMVHKIVASIVNATNIHYRDTLPDFQFLQDTRNLNLGIINSKKTIAKVSPEIYQKVMKTVM